MGAADERRLKALPVLLCAASVAVPVLVGLLATLLPAFGVLPALGGTAFSLAPWRILFGEPGLWASVCLALQVGLGTTAVSVGAVACACAAFHAAGWFARVKAASAPILASPHVAIGLGVLAVAAPSGWVARLISRGAALLGSAFWRLPPDVVTVGDPAGIALVLGLVLKEAPYLLFMAVAALGQIPAMRLMDVARTLGQPAPVAWLKIVFPLVYRQMRLPVLAVLVYAMSSVDMALLLGPDSPPPLANLVVRWFFDPDLSMVFPASAAACLLLAVSGLAVVVWIGAERLAGWVGRAWAQSGARGGSRAIILAGLALPVLVGLAWLGLVAVMIWSVAGPWRFPDLLPVSLDLRTWRDQAAGLAGPLRVSLGAALAATALALGMSVVALDAVARHGPRARPALLGLVLLPLLVPQAGFLFGVQIALLDLGLDGGWPALIWAHLLFVLPYVLLTLSGPWRALDPRLADVAACLGARPWRVLLAVKLPILLRPVLTALAVGVAVSCGQYLSTVFAGGGRLATLATEAVTLASGGDRRVLGVYAVVQMAVPLMFYGLAVGVPRVVWRRRRGLLRA